MNIDRRVRAKEFMALLSIKKDAFYSRVNSGQIPQPVRINKKDVFWYESVVKKEVEKFKDRSE
ncbi:AlpA family phage regulatory protein [Acinetobacter bereziniae]|uniref:helix-turn-helix transcriptional regulator n=1 Tax=Acinetobacter bereziniae TaxID=106648 RepID=UPI001907C0CE|nr:AlpA family phage regulatory protein [Acinetobacter bereziniae]MDG3555304.1 AlpA family phage regulatory protein [Acinetobacter bereziniae]QQC81432.1 AlpA family phage regulatory protein [Acinetobacter bereziniae]UUN94542.1 AlpA family phage regulatory protein [Acinetobacter bereziniae]WMW75606.1 AlpA family phage regulatory protein [Acinetobacter bereziniae]